MQLLQMLPLCSKKKNLLKRRFHVAAVGPEPLRTHAETHSTAPPKVSGGEKNPTFVVSRGDLGYKGGARNVTNQKKKKKFPSHRGEKEPAALQPRHDIAFWCRLDRGEMHIHEVSNV